MFKQFSENSWNPLINCEVNLIIILSPTCVITNSTGEGRVAIRDT